MKRKIDWDEQEHSGDDQYSSEEESDDEEPRIKDVLSDLSDAVSRQKASELLHSMAASKDILFWSPRGQLLRNQRIIPVTNISELVEYVLLPHNDDITKPRALNTFIDGLAELGIDKRLIRNKKVLSDLLQKEKDYNDGDEASDSGNSTDSNGEKEIYYEDAHSDQNSEESETENSDSENDSSIKTKISEPCQHCEGPNVYATAVMKCPQCLWCDNYKICPICDYKIPLDQVHGKDSLRKCYDCGAMTHTNLKTLKTTYYPSNTEMDKDDY